MSGVTAVAAVQARIGAIETRLGARPRPSVSTDANTSATAGATVTRTATSLATTLAAYGIDTTGIDLSSLDTGVTAEVTGNISSTAFDTVLDQVNSSLPQVDGTVGAGTPYAELFNAAGAKYGVSPRVLAAIGYVESRFQTDVVSSAGAVGMMQFLPSTAASMGVDPTDPASSIDGAARYLRSGIDRFGNLEMAIAAYNVGPGAVATSGIQPGSQAETYTNAVLTATGRIQ
jgi:membrane-bound lytic murein transglycosylase B